MPDPSAAVAPEFTAPSRPAMYTKNWPAPGEVEALLADRERLAAFLGCGYRLWRRAMARHRALRWSPLKCVPSAAPGT